MSDLNHDPELPFVVRIRFSEELLGRFSDLQDADQIADTIYGGYDTEVIDTTPKPKIPADATYIFVEDWDQSVFAYRADSHGWMMVSNGLVSEEELLEYIGGDAEVTVLVRKEES